MTGSIPIAPSSRTVLAILLCFLPVLGRAEEPPAAGATVPSDPVFNVQLIDGKPLAGRLRDLGPKDRLRLIVADGSERVVPLNQVVKLTQDGPPVSYTASPSVVLLPDGDRLFGTGIGVAKETTIEVLHFVLVNLTIPLESLVGLAFELPPDPDDSNLILDRVRTEAKATELLWLKNGDRLAGNFLGLDETKVKFQTDNGTLTLDQSGVSALAFDPALIAYPRPEGTFQDLTLSDGSRLGVHHLRLDQGQVVATTRFAEVRFPLAHLLAVHLRSALLVYLTDRPVVREQYIAYVGPTRPFRRDRTVDGHLFRLGGQTYDRGLGTPSRSFLAYRIQPGDQRFQALVGLDDRAGTFGNVIFRVLVDGKERYASPSMSVRDTPRAVDVDLSGGNVLILVTEFGDRGGVRDLGDWVEARLIRGSAILPSAP